MTMTLRHLTIFLKVYQQQHITQAAEQLNLTQPTVSLAIKELETYYGIRLFERLGRGVAPTEAGRELYRYAVHITSLFDEMETRMRNWDSMGVLRVGSSITIGTHILPSLIQSFQTSFPGMQVEAHISNSGEIENRLLSNQIDVGLIESKPAHAELYSVPFLQDSLCALTAPDHPLATRPSVTLKDLADYPFLMREKGSAVRDMVDSSLALQQIAIRPRWESTSTQAMIKGVAAGLGVAVLPRVMVQEAAGKGDVVMLPLTPPLLRRLHLVYHKQKYISPSLQNWITLCQEYGRSAKK